MENRKKLDEMANVFKIKLETAKTQCDNDMRELKEENVRTVEKQKCKTEEDRKGLLSEFGEEKCRLETRIQKLSAFVDNFMTSDSHDKFVKVSRTFPSFPLFPYFKQIFVYRS